MLQAIKEGSRLERKDKRGIPCSHLFRHTLATEVLEMGGTFEEAADILGDTETIVRKHYAKWSAGRQARISDLLARIWHAKKSGAQVLENQHGGLVDLVRFELTTSSMPWKSNQSLTDNFLVFS